MLVGLIRKPTISQIIQFQTSRNTLKKLSTHANKDIKDEEHRLVSEPEFRLSLKNCRPVKVWPGKIGVAFSGGPDSTALLYLLKKACSSQDPLEGLPNEIVALTVDHGLQAASSHMTKKCSELASFLQVKHMKITIPWNVPPFPELPGKDTAFEKVAREARYHVLLEAMVREQLSIIAFGHHADDQVETALLRISRGSSELGASGMRPCRRWGMGFGDGSRSLGWAGHRGMNRWIIRPLLDFPKKRLIDTCIANELNFVQDSTNFQPDLTPRNFIRHVLEMDDDNKTAPVSSDLKKERHTLIRMASRSVHLTSDFIVPPMDELYASCSTEQLRAAVRTLSEKTLHMEHQVDDALKSVLKPSPLSTALVCEDDLRAVSDNAVRIGIVRRILRYVSPFPWGNPRGEAGGRSTSLQGIVSNLCEDGVQRRIRKEVRAKFVAGAAVLWSPVIITSNGHIKHREDLNSGEKRCWLASRQPPIRTLDYVNKDSVRLSDIAENAAADPLELDISSLLTANRLNDTRDVTEVLYDCRFLIRINSQKLSSYVRRSIIQSDRGDVGSASSTRPRLLIVPHTKYFLPKLVLYLSDRGVDKKFEVATLRPDGVVDFPILENNKSESTHLSPSSPRIQEAVTIEWIRLLDADAPYRGPCMNP